MPFTDDLQEAIQVFAEAVRENQTVQLYLVADAALQADPEARDLDLRYQSMYGNLATRQAASELIPQGELEAFYELQIQVREHPLVQDRNRKLTLAKGYVQHLGADFNQKLGLDYVGLVLS